MSITILEALQNAEINLGHTDIFYLARTLGKAQLHNAIVLLEKGYSINDEVDPLLENYGDVEAAPKKD